MPQVHELAVRIVKPSKDELFVQRRTAFIQKLKTQKGVIADREFESFFALPGMDERPVFIGMTTYDQLSTVNWIQMNPMVMLKFMPFFMTMSLKAYVFMEQTEGPDFSLPKLGAKPGSVVHIAVRRPNDVPLDEHLSAQKAFTDLLLARDGVGPHYEFKAVKGFNVEGVTVGITEFADDEAMASAFEALSEHDAFLAYTKTFDTVASQFARTTTNDEENPMSAIYEIAIQKIRPEHTGTYPGVRADFLEQLTEQPGHEQDWTFRSFFTMPEPDDAEVLVGVTRWSSLDHFAAANTRLGTTDLAGRLFSSVEMRAFVRVRPVGDASFRLEQHLTDSNPVVEFAVRRPKHGVTAAQYDTAHDAFFQLVRAQPGFLFDQELADDDGARAVMIGWRSVAEFQQALGALQHREEMGAFFGIIDVQAYQATTLV